ncbi:MAG TPA: hypothetical protein VLG16_02565 [Candidatus Saccharimonadales bacterium]|nr:hypothetical protein [Candidatus Saccharimonadales bacterium]
MKSRKSAEGNGGEVSRATKAVAFGAVVGFAISACASKGSGDGIAPSPGPSSLAQACNHVAQYDFNVRTDNIGLGDLLNTDRPSLQATAERTIAGSVIGATARLRVPKSVTFLMHTLVGYDSTQAGGKFTQEQASQAAGLLETDVLGGLMSNEKGFTFQEDSNNISGATNTIAPANVEFLFSACDSAATV